MSALFTYLFFNFSSFRLKIIKINYIGSSEGPPTTHNKKKMEYINEEAYKEYHEQEYVKLPECRSPDYGVRLLDLSVLTQNYLIKSKIVVNVFIK